MFGVNCAHPPLRSKDAGKIPRQDSAVTVGDNTWGAESREVEGVERGELTLKSFLHGSIAPMGSRG